MVRGTHVEKWIEETGQIAAQEQAGYSRFVSLECQRDDIAHQAHVLADILGQAVVRPLHREDGPTSVARPLFGTVLQRARLFDPLFHIAHTGQILVELCLTRPADVPADWSSWFHNPVQA